jgi:surface protein
MFNGARAFNQNISTNGTAWDVSKVEDMTSMFTDATSFRGNIGNWNTISVTKMTNMFYNATSFDQNIGGWNTSNVQKMDGMFYGTTSFNIDISQWDTSNVDNMNGMFWNATLFNQNINTDGLKWNTSKVKTMTSMFYGASKFNGNITKWNTSNVEDMSYMFYQALKFNQNINYNETYNAWNVTKVTHMTSMFSEAFDFNGDVSKWDTKLVRNMTGLFMYTKFNQDVSNWNVSTVQNMNDMFNGASLFDQDLSKWNITSITNILSMIANTSMSIDNYNKLLNSWSTKQVQLYINFSNNGLIYTDSGKNGRDILRQKWAITNDLYIDREILNPNVPFNITHNNTTSPSKLYITDYNITPDINSPYYSSTNSQYQNVIITTNGKKRITIKNNSNSILYTGYIYVINKMVTDINIPDTIIKNYGDPSQLLNITSTTPSTITYVSRNTNIVTIENNYLVFHNGGTTIIDVTQPDTTNYTSVTRQFTVIVNPIISVINVISNRILIVGNETFPIPISTNETTPFIFESNDSETIGVDNINKRFILKKVGGPVTITVNQAASANFLAASTTFTVTVLPVPCVLKGTKINTEKGYKEVEKLTTEDNVKTVDGYKKVYKISHRSMEHHAVNKRIPDQLYEYVTDNEEPLILTGRHSILVDSLTTEESEKVKEMFGRLYTTENKYRLAVCIDAKSNVYAIPGTYEVYHVALENNNEYTNYGMYANGILVETMSKKNSDKYNNFNMDTIYNAKK